MDKDPINRPDLESLDEFRKNFDGLLAVKDIDHIFQYVKELEAAAQKVADMFPANMTDDGSGLTGFTKDAEEKISDLRSLLAA